MSVRWLSKLAPVGVALVCGVAPPAGAATAAPVAVAAAVAGQAATAAPCRVQVLAITDARRSPELLGVVGGKAIKAPDDREAWLRSVVAGLNTRGVTLVFDGEAGADAPVLQAAFDLRNVWISTAGMTKSAGVFWRMTSGRAGAAPTEQDYRGAKTRANWANTIGEMRGLVDDALALALDAMAADLISSCEA